MDFTASIEGAWQFCYGIHEEANIEAENVDAFGEQEGILDFESGYNTEVFSNLPNLGIRRAGFP